MPDYMEFPDINAPTAEGKIAQLTHYLQIAQEKHNRLAEEVEQLKNSINQIKGV